METIREEVHKTIARAFPGIQTMMAQTGSPILGSTAQKSGETLTSDIDLTGSTPQYVPLAIARSDISVASISPNIREGNSIFFGMKP